MKKLIGTLLIVLSLVLSVFGLAACDMFENWGNENDHMHVLHERVAHDATCEEEGNKLYYECSTCHKLYLDEDAQEETTLKDVTLPKTPHTPNKEPVEATPPQSGEKAAHGVKEHYTCTLCGKSCDEKGTELSEEELIEHVVGEWHYEEGRHYKACEVENCDYVESEHEPEMGEWHYDAESHYQECEAEGCGYKAEHEPDVEAGECKHQGCEYKVEYTLKFYKTADDQSPAEVKVSGKETLGEKLPADPSRTDYHFEGWFLGEEKLDAAFAPSSQDETELSVYADWTIDKTIPTVTADGYTAATPTFLFPEQIKAGSTYTVTGDLKIGSVYNAFDGIFVFLTNAAAEPYTNFISPHYDFWYDNTQHDTDGNKPATQDRNDAMGMTLAKDVAFDTESAWFESFPAFLAAGKELKYTAIIDWSDANSIVIVYRLTTSFDIHTDATTTEGISREHTFTAIYTITAQQGKSFAKGYTVWLGGEKATLTNGKLVETKGEHVHDFVNGACTECFQLQKNIKEAEDFTATPAYTSGEFTAYTPDKFKLADDHADAVLTKGGNEHLVVMGTVKSAVAQNWHSVVWRFKEGYMGRPDNYAALDEGNANFEAWRTGGTRSYEFLIRYPSGYSRFVDWDIYKAIAADATWRIEVDFSQEGVVEVRTTLMANSGTYAGYMFTSTAHIVIKGTVNELHTYIGGEAVTALTVDAYKVY